MNRVENLIGRFNKLMNNDPSICCESVEIDEETYFVTTGTGEGNFAYIQEEFESGIEAAELVESGVYQEFCDASNPINYNPELAKKIYEKLEIRICEAGTCKPMF